MVVLSVYGACACCSCEIISHATLHLLGLEEMWKKPRAKFWRIMLIYIVALSQKQKVLNIPILNWKICHSVMQTQNVCFQDKPGKISELFHFGINLWYLTNSLRFLHFISNHSSVNTANTAKPVTKAWKLISFGFLFA